jgi:hypothetical protein
MIDGKPNGQSQEIYQQSVKRQASSRGTKGIAMLDNPFAKAQYPLFEYLNFSDYSITPKMPTVCVFTTIFPPILRKNSCHLFLQCFSVMTRDLKDYYLVLS